MTPLPKIDYRFAHVIKCDGYTGTGESFKGINPTYKIKESGAILNEDEFKKLGELLAPQGIFLVAIYPPIGE